MFYQDPQGQLDAIGSVRQSYYGHQERNALTPPPLAGKPPVYRRSVSAQESGANIRLNNLQTTQKSDFGGMYYNVPPELVSECEDATNSFDSSYMSSTSDTSDSLNSTFRSSSLAAEGFGDTVAQDFNSVNRHHCPRDRFPPYKSSPRTNEVVVGLAEELTGCKQENKRLTMEKSVLENKVISQQSVIKEISKENISLKKDLNKKQKTEGQDYENKIHKPMTTHVELNKLLKKTQTFGMSSEEKAKLHSEMQASLFLF